MKTMNNFISPKALVDRSQDEYVCAIYGASGLALITITAAVDSTDKLQEKCPWLVKHEIKKYVNEIDKAVSALTSAINVHTRGHKESMWMYDFGNAIYGVIEPYIEQLNFAISNFLGKYPKVPDCRTFASLVIAQSLASEAKNYIDHESKKFERYSVIDKDGRRRSAGELIQALSCAAIKHYLTAITEALIKPCLTEDTDLLADMTIKNGCNAIINHLINPNTWKEARDKADKLNHVEHNEKSNEDKIGN